MVDVKVPAPQLDVSRAPQSEVSSAAFARPNLGTGLEDLGQGADQLASSLARQQAQTDVAKSGVTLDANGVPQMADDHNSILFGQAGEQYRQVWAAGENARLNSAVSNQMEAIRQQHEGDPAGFLTASTNYANALRQTSYGPQVGNVLADQASQEAAQHHTNMQEQMFQRGTQMALSGIQTNIEDTQNKMRVIARQGGIDTPEYQQLQGQLAGRYDALKSNKLFGYAPDRADSELANSLSMDRAEAVVGNVDSVFKKTSGDGGRAGAQKYLTDQVLNNPDLHLSEAERRQVYTYGMAHLEYLTSDQKAAIDANRVNVEKLISTFDAHRPVDPAVVNQAMTQAQSLGDSESVMKIAAYAGQAQKAAPLAGLSDEQKLLAQTGGDYVSTLARAEGGNNPTGGNGGGSFQFEPGTWATLSRTHPELQLTPDGRTDPAQESRAIVAFTRDNAKTLQAAGIEPTDANLRMTHFLGAGAGPAFLKQMAANPAAPAAATNLAAATSNPTIFYKPGANGRPDPSQPRSYQEVYALQTRGFGGTTPIVSSAMQGAPTQAQMKANPFTMTAYLDSLKSEDDVKTARAVGDAMATQLGQGNFPRADTMAAFQQVAERRNDPELNTLNQKVQNLAAGAAAGQAAAAGGPAAAQAFLQNVDAMKRSGGADLMTLQRAEAAKTIYDKSVANLKTDPAGEAANRGWIARPPSPLDFTQPQTIPQGIVERAQAAQAIASHTGVAAQPMFSPAELPQIKSLMTAGTLDQRTALAAAIGGSGAPEAVQKATLGALAGDHATLPLAVAGNLFRDSPETARAILQGQAILQSEPKYGPKREAMPAELATILPHNDLPAAEARDGIGQAARAMYAKLSADANDTTGVVNDDRMRQAIDSVTGGVRSYRGSSIVAPWYGASQYDTDAAIRSLGPADVAHAQTTDGKPFPAEMLKPSWSNAFTFNNWRLQSTGDGKYLVFSGDDKARQYLGDDRGGKFVLDLGAKRGEVARSSAGTASQSPFSSMPFTTLPVGGPL